VKNPPLEAMQVIAPDGTSAAQGTIFLDQLQFQKVGWLRTPDYQLPFINSTRGGPNVSDDMKDEHIDINGYHWSQLKPPATSTITAEQKQAFKTIADRYDQWLYGKDLDPKSEPYYQIRFDALSKYIESGKAAFEQLHIHSMDGAITGTPTSKTIRLMNPTPITTRSVRFLRSRSTS
jgi:hypothetical protein